MSSPAPPLAKNIAHRACKATDLILGSMEDDMPLGQQQNVVEEVVHLWCRLQKRYEDCRLRRQICALSFRPTSDTAAGLPCLRSSSLVLSLLD